MEQQKNIISSSEVNKIVEFIRNKDIFIISKIEQKAGMAAGSLSRYIKNPTKYPLSRFQKAKLKNVIKIFESLNF